MVKQVGRQAVSIGATPVATFTVKSGTMFHMKH